MLTILPIIKMVLENTREGLKRQKPQFIVIMPNAGSYPFSLSSYNLKMNLAGVNIYEKLSNNIKSDRITLRGFFLSFYLVL